MSSQDQCIIVHSASCFELATSEFGLDVHITSDPFNEDIKVEVGDLQVEYDRYHRHFHFAIASVLR